MALEVLARCDAVGKPAALLTALAVQVLAHATPWARRPALARLVPTPRGLLASALATHLGWCSEHTPPIAH